MSSRAGTIVRREPHPIPFRPRYVTSYLHHMYWGLSGDVDKARLKQLAVETWSESGSSSDGVSEGEIGFSIASDSGCRMQGRSESGRG